MDGGATASPSCHRVILRIRVLVLAKQKALAEKKNTLPLRLVRSAVLLCLDIAMFVRDGMTALAYIVPERLRG